MTAAAPTPEARASHRFFAFLATLRGVAVLLVVYDHLGAIWPESNGMSWPPTRFIRTWINEPLAIIQDFGFFGVVLFFLISGFIITHVAQRETRYQFAVKRILRIYPPLIASIIVIIVITAIRGGVLLSWKQYLLSFTLLNYFWTPQYVVNGVAWTLVIEMLFYAGAFAVLPFLKRRAVLGSAILIAAVALIIWQARSFGANFFLFSASVAYLPFLLQGQIIYLRWTRKISTVQYAALAVATYAVTVYGIRTIHTAYLPADNSYMVSFAYAFFIFVLGLLFEGMIRIPRFISFTSNISYSLYLFHGVVGFLVLDLLTPKVNLTIAIAVAFAVALGSAYASYRWIERPSQTAARWIIQHTPSRKADVSA